jgi:hypothetical protein
LPNRPLVETKAPGCRPLRPVWNGAGVDCLREVGPAGDYRPVITLRLRKDGA